MLQGYHHEKLFSIDEARHFSFPIIQMKFTVVACFVALLATSAFAEPNPDPKYSIRGAFKGVGRAVNGFANGLTS